MPTNLIVSLLAPNYDINYFRVESCPFKIWEKSIFLHSNYGLSLILAMQLQNRVSLTVELSQAFIFDHLAVLKGGFADVDDTWQ